ncbi:MAG: 5'-3' exonuclease [Clostridia bacterium]|nr:5'-3' exonuclease [Clostridia bacterium]
MKRLLLVDGSNLLFQMFFGMPARIINAEGKAIHGTLGFVGALLKMIRMTNPTHAAVLFDGEHKNERSAIHADYKANRTDYSQMPESETPFSQLPDIKAALDYLKIRHAETTDCETDDWMAAYARLADTGFEVIIASFDSDFFQLISKRVSILRYRGDKTVICTPEWLQNKFDIFPSQYADFKALTGDVSDNIKGADRVGPKTAAALLHQFGSLEQLLAHTEKITKPGIQQSIRQNHERLRQNQKLIHLTGNVPLPYTLSELQYFLPDMTTTQVLKAIQLR